MCVERVETYIESVEAYVERIEMHAERIETYKSWGRTLTDNEEPMQTSNLFK